jgi:hypothetical protein
MSESKKEKDKEKKEEAAKMHQQVYKYNTYS